MGVCGVLITSHACSWEGIAKTRYYVYDYVWVWGGV